MAYNYYAQGRRMPWYEWFTLFKEKALIMPLPTYHLYMLYPPESANNATPSLTSGVEIQRRTELAHELYDKRPDLLSRYGYISMAPTFHVNQQNPIYRFILRQYHWMQKGLTKTAAFDKAESEFAAVFLTEQRHSSVLKEVAGYAGAVSYFNYYQEVAAREGRLKVKRLLSDLEKHTRMKNYSAIDSTIPADVKKWERVKARYYSQEILIPRPVNAQEVKTRFATYGDRLLKIYNLEAHLADGLRALQNEEILWDVKDTNKFLGRSFRSLYKEMTDLGVKMNEKGEIDVSTIENPELKKLIKEIPLLKAVLFSQGNMPHSEDPKPTPPKVPKLEESIDTTDETLVKRRAKLRELWSIAESQKRNPAEQLNIQTAAVESLRKIRKKMDLKLMKSGDKPLFPSIVATYKKGEYDLDEGLDMNVLTELMKKNSADPVLTEKERHEIEQVEQLSMPVDVIEKSRPVTVDQNGSSVLHDEYMKYFDEIAKDLYIEEDIATEIKRASGLKEDDDTPSISSSLVYEFPEVITEIKADEIDEYFYDEEIDETEVAGPSTRKETIKFSQKKGKLSSALSKLGRKK